MKSLFNGSTSGENSATHVIASAFLEGTSGQFAFLIISFVKNPGRFRIIPTLTKKIQLGSKI